MAALEVGAELDLVDRDEGDIEVARHRLDRRDPEARIGGLDLLLAGDQRHRIGAGAFGYLVVDLAGEQPQRQADEARRMRQHALDGEMGLAGIGRPQHRGDAMAAGTQVAVRWRTERDRHAGLRRRTDRPAQLKLDRSDRLSVSQCDGSQGAAAAAPTIANQAPEQSTPESADSHRIEIRSHPYVDELEPPAHQMLKNPDAELPPGGS